MPHLIKLCSHDRATIARRRLLDSILARQRLDVSPTLGELAQLLRGGRALPPLDRNGRKSLRQCGLLTIPEVGARVEAYWSTERRWFAGTVQSEPDAEGEQRVDYDDGFVESIVLGDDRKWRYAALSDEAVSHLVASGEDEAREVLRMGEAARAKGAAARGRRTEVEVGGKRRRFDSVCEAERALGLEVATLSLLGKQPAEAKRGTDAKFIKIAHAAAREAGITNITVAAASTNSGSQKRIPGEEWKLDSASGRQVSNMGRVKMKDGSISCGWIKKENGYKCFRGTDGSSHYVHRAVARVFSNVSIDGMHVHHLDEDKSNNRAANLRVMTPAEHAAEHAGHGEAARRAAWKHNSKAVVATRAEDGKEEAYVSLTAAGRAMSDRYGGGVRGARWKIGKAASASNSAFDRTWSVEADPDLPNERWLELPGSNGALVSSRGRLRHTEGTRQGTSSFGERVGGYLRTKLPAAVEFVNEQRRKQGVTTVARVVNMHELVARIFNAAPPALPRHASPGDFYTVHHKNGVRTDNRPENLLWLLGSVHQRLHQLALTYEEAVKTSEIVLPSAAPVGTSSSLGKRSAPSP